MTVQDMNELQSQIEGLTLEAISLGVDPNAPVLVEQLDKRHASIREKHARDFVPRPTWYLNRKNAVLFMRDSMALTMQKYMTFSMFGVVLFLFLTEAFAVGEALFFMLKSDSIPDWFTFGLSALMSSTALFAYFGIEWLHASHVHNKDTSTISMVYVRYVMIFIIALFGVFGRLHNLISSVDNVPFMEGMGQILSQSDVNDVASIFLVGFLFPVGLLTSTSFFLRYNYQVYAKAVGSSEINFLDEADLDAKLLQAQKNFLQVLVARKKNQLTVTQTQAQPQTSLQAHLNPSPNDNSQLTGLGQNTNENPMPDSNQVELSTDAQD